ncbi:MAG: hypothetical protein RQ745_04825 [Longimicrobiales bacterium]|nr:hypothetical protein [Longimicrobiales bacterium]
MKTRTHRNTDQRRLFGIGIGVSALVHLAVLGFVVVPVEPLDEGDVKARRQASQLDAMEVIRIAEPKPVTVATFTDPGASSSSRAARAATRSPLEVVEVRSIARLAFASPIRTENFGELTALEVAEAEGYSEEYNPDEHIGHAHTQEDGQSFWGRLLGGVQAAFSGEHCPLDDPASGVTIQTARGGTFNPGIGTRPLAGGTWR